MSISSLADLIAETLEEAGVRRIYGLVGDSLNAITESLRERKHIDWVHVRNEEAGGLCRRCAKPQLTGQLAVCAGSCGPGNLHLINGLFDCQRTRTPVLAIAAHIPSAEIGSGILSGNASDGAVPRVQRVLRDDLRSRRRCRIVSESAIRAAVGQRGVAVMVIPGDVAMRESPVKTVTPPRRAAAARAEGHPRRTRTRCLGGPAQRGQARHPALRPGHGRCARRTHRTRRCAQVAHRARAGRQGISSSTTTPSTWA